MITFLSRNINIVLRYLSRQWLAENVKILLSLYKQSMKNALKTKKRPEKHIKGSKNDLKD